MSDRGCLANYHSPADLKPPKRQYKIVLDVHHSSKAVNLALGVPAAHLLLLKEDCLSSCWADPGCVSE